MYVRWKRRTLQPSSHNTTRETVIVEDAVLVDCVRMDGKPTQRHICHLGSITIWPTALGVLDRDRFWGRAKSRLAELDVSAKDSVAIEAALAKKVPHPERDPAHETGPLVRMERLGSAREARLAELAGSSSYLAERGAACIKVFDALERSDRKEEAAVVRTALGSRSITAAFRYCVQRGYVALPPKQPRIARGSV